MRLIDADRLSLAKFQSEAVTYQKGWNDAIDTIIENEPTVRQWIPCSERLPEGDIDSCLVTVKYKTKERYIAVSEFRYGQFGYYGVVAWMPLPKPYKGET